MAILTIILISLIIVFASLSIYAFKTRKTINTYVQEKNDKLEQSNYELLNRNQELILSTTNLSLEKTELQGNILAKQEELQRLQATVEATAAAQKDLVNQAFSSYCDTLDQAYLNAEQDFDLKIAKITYAINQEQKKLSEIKTTRAAAHEALLKEQEIKENKDNYRLIPSSNDLEDIHELERVKNSLHKPRILSMLIWQTYWQPLAKIRFPQILKEKTRCGIYKITNTWTNECYIGQSVDIYKRWCEHCKCGLGIDSPPGNKLYKAMQEYGLETFTFEILAECTKEELDKNEKYFIELYQAKEFGYNGTGGNK